MATPVRSDEIARFHSSIRLREISPELILVDAELARVARAALPWPAESAAATRTAPALAETSPEQVATPPLYYALDPQRIAIPVTHPRTGRWDALLAAASSLLSVSVSVVLFASLLVNLALAGALLGGGDAPEFAAPPPASLQPSPSRSAGEVQGASQVTRLGSAATRPTTAGQRRGNRRAVAKATAERMVLRLVQTAPRSQIGALLDPKSGLLRNNVQAICRRRGSSARPGFRCVVRPGGAPRGAGLYARYTAGRGGRWTVMWLGYRKGSRVAAPGRA